MEVQVMEVDEPTVRLEMMETVQDRFFKEERDIASASLLLIQGAPDILLEVALDLCIVDL
jgi:hypothetical protein